MPSILVSYQGPSSQFLMQQRKRHAAGLSGPAVGKRMGFGYAQRLDPEPVIGLTCAAPTRAKVKDVFRLHFRQRRADLAPLMRPPVNRIEPALRQVITKTLSYRVGVMHVHAAATILTV